MLTLTMESAIVLCLFVPFPRTLRDAEGPVRMVPNPTTHTSTVSSALSLDIRLWPDAWLGVGWFLFSQRWRLNHQCRGGCVGENKPSPCSSDARVLRVSWRSDDQHQDAVQHWAGVPREWDEDGLISAVRLFTSTLCHLASAGSSCGRRCLGLGQRSECEREGACGGKRQSSMQHRPLYTPLSQQIVVRRVQDVQDKVPGGMGADRAHAHRAGDQDARRYGDHPPHP
jgi:hypothetical protein